MKTYNLVGCAIIVLDAAGWVFKLVANNAFAVFSQIFSFPFSANLFVRQAVLGRPFLGEIMRPE